MAAGFDALDIKATHGYLLNELMGAKKREVRAPCATSPASYGRAGQPGAIPPTLST